VSRLATLQKIVQGVSSSAGLNSALELIVNDVKTELSVDVCSIYLNLPGSEELTLMASNGLLPWAVGKVKLKLDEGLVGMVADHAEPINLSDAPAHPSYKFLPDTGEEHFHAFLGVPIIHHRRLHGVLVIQQAEKRSFDEDDVAFLITLGTQLAVAISNAEMTGELTGPENERHEDVFIEGIAGSPGVAVGTAVVIFPEADLDAVPDRQAEDIKVEKNRFLDAVAQVQQDMIELKERLNMLPAEDRILFDAYMMMLNSDTLLKGTLDYIESGDWAPGALRKTIFEHTRVFEEMEDSYLGERAADVRDLGQRVLARMQTNEPRQIDCPPGSVLVSHEISATQLAEVPQDNLVGLVCSRGSSASHVAILARALGIPTVMGASKLPVGRVDGREMVVDGYLGRLCLQPSIGVRSEYLRLADEERELSEELLTEANQPAITLDGTRIPIFVNSGLLADLLPSQKAQADGIGLYRTELPFMVRDQFPSEEEQTSIYRRVLTSFSDSPVTLRTLDIGGDKALSYFPVVEDNPFLGWRGIRITLDHPEIFLAQLRAMLRASQSTGNLHILFPMIGSVQQLEEALGLLALAEFELEQHGVSVPAYKTGVMIEIPSAVYMAEQLAGLVDFLSVGSNDLIQYLLAVDRNNTMVADLYEDTHPAVLMALKASVEGAHKAGKPISLCGEMASDPAASLLLLGMGFDSFSVSLASVPRIKWVMRSFSSQQATQLFEYAVELADAAAVRRLLDEALVNAGLGGLVRPGKR